MSCEVRSTAVADRMIEALRGRQRASYDSFERDLAHRGCKAMGYRLTGSVVDRLCVRHLAGALRVVVAFERPDRAWVLLVGVHDDSDPRVNVYALLSYLAGIGTPDQSKRTKPACCDETTDHPPSFSEDDLDELFQQIRQLDPAALRHAQDAVRAGRRRSAR